MREVTTIKAMGTRNKHSLHPWWEGNRLWTPTMSDHQRRMEYKKGRPRWAPLLSAKYGKVRFAKSGRIKTGKSLSGVNWCWRWRLIIYILIQICLCEASTIHLVWLHESPASLGFLKRSTPRNAAWMEKLIKVLQSDLGYPSPSPEMDFISPLRAKRQTWAHLGEAQSWQLLLHERWSH